MQPAVVLLTKSFRADQYSMALESWEWIGVGGKEPVLASLFGHVFLRDADGFWHLDHIAGTLELHWPTAADLNAALDTENGQDEYLLGALAMSAERQGLQLSQDQVYDFNPPPVLGGSFDVANLTAIDFVVAVNIAGQIHQQVKDLPPGSRIGGVTVEGARPSRSRRRWRR